MKKFLVATILLFAAGAAHAADIGDTDGAITFINGAPSFYQLAVSTTIPNLTATQVKLLVISKPAIVDKVIELESVIAAIEHFIARYPAFTAAANNKMNKIKAQIDLLVSLYNSL